VAADCLLHGGAQCLFVADVEGGNFGAAAVVPDFGGHPLQLVDAAPRKESRWRQWPPAHGRHSGPMPLPPR